MNQAIIAFDVPTQIVAGDFGPEPVLKSSVVKVASDVETGNPDSITGYADFFILPQAENVNLADKSATVVTKVKGTDVTSETEHPFGIGVGYVKIRYVMP